MEKIALTINENPIPVVTVNIEKLFYNGYIIRNSISIIFITALIFTILFVILAGMKWLRCGKDKTKAKDSKNTFIKGINGLVIILLVYVTNMLIIFLFGADTFELATTILGMHCTLFGCP